MNSKKSKIKTKVSSIFTSISSYLILLFQYVPATGIWFGIMSIPFVTYLTFFFQNPSILFYDIQFILGTYGVYIVFFGLFFYIYSLIYQITHRKQLMREGPYKYVRHPQYFAFIIITLGMTVITFQTSPIFEFPVSYENGFSILFFIWIGEVIAYILLGKIEEIALKSKYGDNFLEYRDSVAFIIPFLKIRITKIDKA
ncbi:MAG: hypothetical protein KGD67_00895 [Candidatus Lokiarchaeota archaeon]|nr:hypothetical protein [Candidatus Lokiarchaeota archaeon]